VSIFRRNKPGQDPEQPVGSDADHVDEATGGDVEDPTPAEGSDGGEEPGSREHGPYDLDEVEGRENRVDLGALWLPAISGMELRLEVDQRSQQVNAATVVLGESALQLQAFAAPRSSGLWSEIRDEIRRSVERQGGTAEEHEGDLGPTLRTRMPSESGGRTVFAPATFVGVDGPRWFLRGVISGRAAIDDAEAGRLVDLFRDVVVVRGVEPMAPRELIPLRLPADAQAAAEQSDESEGDRRPSDVDPFERGPEITEVR
jgi:hypothetical protein